MRITIVALGTRGDVQPMLALGKGLQAAGHTITLIAGENFADWVRSHGFDFVGTVDIEVLMKSPVGIAWVEEPNPLKQLGHMKNLLNPHGAQMVAPIVDQAQQTDLLISGFVSEPFVQSVSEKYGVPQINTLLQPYHASRSSWATMTAVVKGNSLINYAMGRFGERLIWGVAAETANQLRARLNLPPHNASSYAKAARHIPSLYGFSPRIVPPAVDWTSIEQVVGYWFLEEQQSWEPPEALVRFLASGAPPVYVGFGSMSSSSPQQSVDLITAALRQAGQRGIVAAGWSGAQAVSSNPDVFMLDKAPHDWLFERVAGIVHHGGAGTTGAALRSGTPSLIIPHMSDQPFWGKRVYELGVGAKPIPRQKLTVANLAAGIQTLVSDMQMNQAASALGARIRAENGVANAVALIGKWTSAD